MSAFVTTTCAIFNAVNRFDVSVGLPCMTDNVVYEALGILSQNNELYAVQVGIYIGYIQSLTFAYPIQLKLETHGSDANI